MAISCGQRPTPRSTKLRAVARLVGEPQPGSDLGEVGVEFDGRPGDVHRPESHRHRGHLGEVVVGLGGGGGHRGVDAGGPEEARDLDRVDPGEEVGIGRRVGPTVAGDAARRGSGPGGPARWPPGPRRWSRRWSWRGTMPSAPAARAGPGGSWSVGPPRPWPVGGASGRTGRTAHRSASPAGRRGSAGPPSPGRRRRPGGRSTRGWGGPVMPMDRRTWARAWTRTSSMRASVRARPTACASRSCARGSMAVDPTNRPCPGDRAGPPTSDCGGRRQVRRPGQGIAVEVTGR